MKFEIVHSGPTTLYMRGIISRLRCGVGDAEIWRRHEGTQWLSGAVIKDSSNLLGHIQDGLDTALHESLPIASVILGAKPDTW